MAAWLTTHWPDKLERQPWCIYLKKKYESLAEQIHQGDRIFFYELKGKSGQGRQKVMGMSVVIGGKKPNPYFSGPPERRGEFIWCIPCEEPMRGEEFGGPTLDAILGPGFRKLPLIPGGIKSINELVADRMCKALKL